MENLQAVFDGFGRVVLADDELLAAGVADALDLGRVCRDVIACTAAAADAVLRNSVRRWGKRRWLLPGQ